MSGSLVEKLLQISSSATKSKLLRLTDTTPSLVEIEYTHGALFVQLCLLIQSIHAQESSYFSYKS